jgi:hypothetical protein
MEYLSGLTRIKGCGGLEKACRWKRVANWGGFDGVSLCGVVIEETIKDDRSSS